MFERTELYLFMGSPPNSGNLPCAVNMMIRRPDIYNSTLGGSFQVAG